MKSSPVLGEELQAGNLVVVCSLSENLVLLHFLNCFLHALHSFNYFLRAQRFFFYSGGSVVVPK